MDHMRPYSRMLFFEGVLFFILGIIALVIPFAFTIGIELLLGILFVIGGVVQGYRAFISGAINGFWMTLISSILLLIAGITMLTYPLTGILTLTLLIIFFFLIDGISKLVLSFQTRGSDGWYWILFSGIIELVLAALLWTGWPSTAIWLVGTMVGIYFLFQGLIQISIASALKTIR